MVGTLALRLLSDGQGLGSRAGGDGFSPRLPSLLLCEPCPCGVSCLLRVPGRPGLVASSRGGQACLEDSAVIFNP